MSSQKVTMGGKGEHEEEGLMPTLIETTHGFEALAQIGEGAKGLLEHAGAWEGIQEMLTGAGLPTVAALGAGVSALHLVTPLIAFLLYSRGRRKAAKSEEERARFEVEERAEHERMEGYLKALCDPQVRADESRTREQVAYLVGAAAKKEDVWEVSRKLDRLLALNAKEFRNFEEKAAAAPDLSAFIDAIPALFDRLDAIHTDVRETRDVAKATYEAVTKLALSERKPTWTIPKPSPYYTEHKGYLDELAAILDADGTAGLTQPVGLRGFGGVGKTELALAYAAAQKGKRYDHGHFMVADSLAALDFGLAKIADPNLPSDATQGQIEPLKQAALALLNDGTRTLVVFDNVDEIVRSGEFGAVLNAIPNAHVIVTCRHPDMGGEIQQLPVEKMEETTGGLYVLRAGRGQRGGRPWAWEEFTEKEREDALALSRELDGLPLALHHAGTAMRGESMSAAEVLTDYWANRGRILGNRDRRGPATHPESAQVMVTRAFERLKKKDRAAAELVLCCAFLAPDAIAEDLFTAGMIRVGGALKVAIGRFKDVRRTALASSLIDRDPEQATLSIHRVTQAVLQDMESVDAKSQFSDVAETAARNLFNRGRYIEAMSNLEFVFVETQRRKEERHPENHELMGKLASIYWRLGRYKEGQVLEEDTLSIRRRLLGDRHPDTLSSINNLATIYSAMADQPNAMKLHKEVFELQRETLGPKHPSTLVTMNNIALVYLRMGLTDEGTSLIKETCNLRHEVLGNQHPDTLRSMSNLAGAYKEKGRYREALLIDEKVLESRREILGVRHPDTIRSMSHVAVLRWLTGRRDEGLELHEEVLEASKQVLGAIHPDTLMTMDNLADSYFRTGRVEEAVAILKAAIEGSDSTFGKMHPNTIKLRMHLERCL